MKNFVTLNYLLFRLKYVKKIMQNQEQELPKGIFLAYVYCVTAVIKKGH